MGFVEPTIYALSNSRIGTYDGCPKKAYFKFILKLKEEADPQGPMARGLRLHKMQEDWINALTSGDGGVPFPVALNKVKKPLMGMIKRDGVLSAEHQLAFDISWNPVSWFDKSTAWRAIYDAAVDNETEVLVQDLKSGKVYDSHDGDMDRYALSAFMWKPDAQEVTVEYHYLDQGLVSKGEYTRGEDLIPLKDEYEEHASSIRADTIFAANPSYKCKWCFQRRSAGGQCEHG